MHGTRLREARELAGLTQQELSEKSQTSPRSISRYESSDSEADEAALKRIAIVLNVSTDYLLGLSDNPRSVSQLSDDERSVLSAMRRGDKIGAVKAIVGS